MSDVSDPTEGSPVYGSQGGCLGYVAGVEDGVLLVDCVGVRGARLHVPLAWVVEAGESVRLSRSCNEVREDWRTSPALGS